MQTETTELTAAWLAEHIMGWTELPRDALWSGRDLYPVFRQEGEDLCVCHGLHTQAFNPLEDIADAWQLVEAIEEKPASEWYGYRIDLHRVSSHDEPHRPYACRFFLRGHEPFLTMPTAPEAICHAAYAWWLGYG